MRNIPVTTQMKNIPVTTLMRNTPVTTLMRNIPVTALMRNILVPNPLLLRPHFFKTFPYHFVVAVKKKEVIL